METFRKNEITDQTKEACAIETMRYMLQKYAREQDISFEEAFFNFSVSRIYDTLFDFETEVWKEGPDYLRSLFDREKHRCS